MENKKEENRLLKNIKQLHNPEESKKYFPLKEQPLLEIKTPWFQQEGKQFSLFNFSSFLSMCSHLHIIMNFWNIYGRSEELYGWWNSNLRFCRFTLSFGASCTFLILSNKFPHSSFYITILNKLFRLAVFRANIYFRISATNFEKWNLSHLKIDICD